VESKYKGRADFKKIKKIKKRIWSSSNGRKLPVPVFVFSLVPLMAAQICLHQTIFEVSPNLASGVLTLSPNTWAMIKLQTKPPPRRV